jgi:hypothetical protein
MEGIESKVKVYKTPSYTRRAIHNYQEKNRELINSKYRERYENDPEFRERESAKAKRAYLKQKAKKDSQKSE